MAPSRLSPEERERERQRYRTKLAKALTEEDDPLAVYYQFVEWTLKHYGEKDTKSGLKSLLEEATRVFKEDQVYKTDLRYLKLWSLHARQLPRADAIDVYASLLSNDIGTDYSMLYEEYAHLLEKDGKAKEANSIYCKGIERNARPRERLKNRYREFQSRATSKSSTSNNPPSVPSSSSQLQRASSVTMVSTTSTPQSRYAVMLAPPAPGKRPETFRCNISLLFTEESGEYSIQEARAKSMGLLGKKWAPLPVTTRFSASTIRDDANTDMQKSTRTGNVLRRKSLYGGGAEPTVTINTKEALADVFGMYNSPDKTRSIGLPGTKHAPLKKVEPITPIAQPRFTATNENENRSRNENDPPHNFKTPTTTFRPFIDENANANHITPASGKFTPFVDPSANKTPSAINVRPVLSVKETSLASSSSPRSVEFSSVATPASSEAVFSKVFTPAGREQTPPLREVFTDQHGKPQPKSKLPTHERAQSSPSAGSEIAPSSKDVHPFRPLVDSENAWTPFKVFSRPPDQEQAQPASHVPQTASGDSRSTNLGKENPFTPKTPVAAPDTKPSAFTPFRDENKASTFAAASTPAFKPFVDPADKENAPAVPASVFAKPVAEAQPSAVLASNVGWPSSGVSSSSSSSFSDLAEMPEHVVTPVQYEDEYDDDEYDEGDDLDQAQGMAVHALQQHVVETDSEYEYEGESFQDAHHHHHHHYQDPESMPLGGRFGQINVMTPISERTIEYTMSTHAGTPSDRLRSNEYIGKDFDEGEEEDGDFDMRELTGYQHRSELDAQRAAERLAAELQAEEEEESSVEQKLYPHEGGENPGGLSLADTLTLSSKFKPPNPCNPFDATILSTLLSRIPLDSHFYDLRSQESGMLDALQKFTKPGSGRKSGVDLTYFSLNLNGQRFSVSEKLGEGGFGSVFKARILGARPPDSDEDEEDLEDGDDESAISYVALKVVRPRNLWEYHVLRRLHSALSPVARRSVVLPHCLYAFKDESFLVLDFCPQGTLLTTVNNAVAAGVSQQGGCLDELLVMFFSIELLRLVEAMHSVGFIHGDLKIDNCLLRLEDVPGGVSAWSSMYQPSGEGGWAYKGLRIIDFGRTIDTRLFPDSQQYLAEWETDERDCFEARENKPWTYQADYFGLAGIIYCMLFGKYLQTSSIVIAQKDDVRRRYKIGTPFKRYWQADLWNRIFDILLNPLLVRADGSLPLCGELEALRKEMEKWLRANCNRSSNTLKGLLKKVEVASLR